jgi:peptidoglycan LD-endopeptidase LytH
MSRHAIAAAAFLVLAAAGCGGSPATPRALSAQPSTRSESPTPSLSQSTPAAASPSPSVASPPGTTRYVFPVVGTSSYAHTHHDYPASDIIAPCGATALSPVDGTVLEVNRVDTYDPKVNAGPTRGGLSVSILGADNVRYYGSHYSSIDVGIEPGVQVHAGQHIAIVGRTGDAGACHVHFGLSPPCAKTGDWFNRRGVIWPWPYLDSWRAGTPRSPFNEIVAWQNQHGCPTKPLNYP